MNKRDSARILALGCHPVHTYSCLFALAAPWWHLEHLFRPAPLVSLLQALAPFPSSPLAAVSFATHPHTYIVTYLSRTQKTIAGVAGGGCYRRENTWNAPEIYVEFTEVLYAAESRARPVFLHPPSLARDFFLSLLPSSFFLVFRSRTRKRDTASRNRFPVYWNIRSVFLRGARPPDSHRLSRRPDDQPPARLRRG